MVADPNDKRVPEVVRACVAALGSQLLSLKKQILEPIREVWIHAEAFAASRLSMMRIMAMRTKATTVVA